MSAGAPPPDVTDPAALARQGARALQTGEWAVAERAFVALMAAGQADAAIHTALGMARLNLGDAAAARAAADAALALDPGYARALVLRGDAFEASGLGVEALEAWRRALAAPGAANPAPDLAALLTRARARIAQAAERAQADLARRIEGLGPAGDDDADPIAGWRARHAVDLLFGRAQRHVQQPRRLYWPGLPDIGFYPRAATPFLSRLEAATQAIRQELLAIMRTDTFAPYVEGDAAAAARDRHGLVGNPDWSAWYLWRDGAPLEANLARCPATAAALEGLPLARARGRTPNVLFSLLRPGMHIPPHHGLVNTRLICHLPLIVPPGCAFRVGAETREWREGVAWAFDDTIEHEAWNRSDQTRVILLLDVWKPELTAHERQVVEAVFEAVDTLSPATDWSG